VAYKAIVGGTGYEKGLEGSAFERRGVSTAFGDAVLYVGSGEHSDLVFIPRHGSDHSTPPHRIDYRANIMALRDMGVDRIVAMSAVGGLVPSVPPGAIVVVDQLIDRTHGRSSTFFDGGEWGVAHADVTEPYCRALRAEMIARSRDHGINLIPEGVYVAVQGPRLETAAEVREYAASGGTVVGMTGSPEFGLARELGIHYMSVCTSVNLAAGLDGDAIIFDAADQERQLSSLFRLSVEVLRSVTDTPCTCSIAREILHEPTAWDPHRS